MDWGVKKDDTGLENTYSWALTNTNQLGGPICPIFALLNLAVSL
jgi:hypothetical protein